MKKLIRSLSSEEARRCSEEVLRQTTADEITQLLRERFGSKLSDLGVKRSR